MLKDAHDPERRATDDDALEAQAQPEQVAVKGLDGWAGQQWASQGSGIG